MQILKFIIFSCIALSSGTYSNLPSSFPFIAGDTFRSIANFIIDETNTNINPHKIKGSRAESSFKF